MKLNIIVMVTKDARNQTFSSGSGNVFLRTDGKALIIYELDDGNCCETFKEGEFTILNIMVEND